jgi:hypothetical protein
MACDIFRVNAVLSTVQRARMEPLWVAVGYSEWLLRALNCVTHGHGPLAVLVVSCAC